MEIRVIYRNGEVDIHDTSSFTANNPFDSTCIMTTFKARADDLSRGLFVETHYHSIDYTFTSADHDASIASVNPGPEINVIPNFDMDRIREIAIDGVIVAKAFGEHLVDMARYQPLLDFYEPHGFGGEAVRAYNVYLNLCRERGLADTPETVSALAPDMGWHHADLLRAVDVGRWQTAANTEGEY